MNFSSVLVEPDFVHQLVDQENAAPMIGVDVLSVARIGNFCGIEIRARVADHDQHALLLVAGYVALHDL